MLLVLLLPAGVGWAKEVFPLPEFTDYQIPQTTIPAARAAWLECLDVAALLAGLALASYLALVRRSRRGLVLLAIVSLAWLGFWRKGCICPIGAIQNVTLGIFDSTYAVPLAALLFLTLPLVFTLFFGRTFCAAVCPLGAAQELVAVRPVKVPIWLDHTLGLVPYIYLGAAVVFAATGSAFLICRYDPFVGFFRLGGSTGMLLFGAGLLVIGVFIGRPYCRYLCPLGAILGVLSKVAQWHVKIPPEDCIRCRLCEDSCPYGAIREPTVQPPMRQRPGQRRRLAGLVVLLPVLVAVCAWLGTRLDVALARLHPTIQLAEQIRLEETGQAADTTEASEAFRSTGRALADLYREAVGVQRRFARAGAWLGAWVGLVFGAKLIHLSIRRRRTGYQPDRAGCVACGRCFWYCPSEQARQGWIQDIEPPSPSGRGSG